ncbi:MAG: UvrD-helicase domain-containing protein [Bacteroidales bacterium]|jgi:ATP-dependent exoDNAse (exonuclease V) beta subunit
MAQQQQSFVVYKSSAGSGKTFTLVREYLLVVLKNPDHFRRVLAITFTNKAANEMKERVVRCLIDLTDPVKHADSDTIRYMLPQLRKDLQMGDEMLANRALAALRLIMHHYAEFAISTIDSFTHRVIRTFAYDLKIPMNFEVELESEEMLGQAVDLLISQVGVDEKLTRVMVDFTEKKAGDEHSWHIEKDLQQFGRTLLNEDSVDFLHRLREYDIDTFTGVRARLLEWKLSWENRLKAMASRLHESFIRSGIAPEAIHGQSKGAPSFLEKLAKGDFGKLSPGTFARKSLESGAWIKEKASPGQHAAFDGIAHELAGPGQDLIEMIDRDKAAYTLCSILLNHIFSTALLGEMEKQLDILTREDNKLLISEFNRRISGIVRAQPAPFIYERLGERYHHFLLDEFQDTSILQWHNLLPLIENSLASGRMSLLVGDAKQAIYRWRSGDAEQLERLPLLIRKPDDPLLQDREMTLARHYREDNLAVNYRSSPVIVDFNNRFFSMIQPLLPENHSSAYQQVIQEAGRKDKPGMIRIETAATSDKEDYMNEVMDKILDVIRELKSDEYSLGDVAILCRDNKNASRIAAFLMHQDVRVISSESLLLSQSDHVNFIVAWMLHLNDPLEGIPVAHIVRYLVANGFAGANSLETLFFAQTGEEESDNDQNTVLQRFLRLLTREMPGFGYASLNTMELLGFTQYLILYFGLDKQQDSYLRFFQDAVQHFLSTRRGGIPEFLEWWEQNSRKTSVIIPEGIDAVRIMTIHKAKGLQFPVVIFPFADEEARATRKHLWVPLQLEFARPLNIACLPTRKVLEETEYNEIYSDEMARSHIDMVNVLYVALTRPEERLYVITKPLPEKPGSNNSVPKLFSSFFQAEGMWEKERTVYQYGERWKRPKKTEEPVSAEAPSGPPPGRSSLRLLLRQQAPLAWDMEDPVKNREWGNLVHLALSMIRNERDAAGVLQDLKLEGIITSEQQADLSGIIDGLMHHPEIGRFFSASYEVRNEPEMMDEKGKLYRPDRVIFRDNKATVIDYKTGKPSQYHNKQVQEYADLLRQMQYEVEGAYLVYLDKKPVVVEVHLV